jgi:hypothetical protein
MFLWLLLKSATILFTPLHMESSQQFMCAKRTLAGPRAGALVLVDWAGTVVVVAGAQAARAAPAAPAPKALRKLRRLRRFENWDIAFPPDQAGQGMGSW